VNPGKGVSIASTPGIPSIAALAIAIKVEYYLNTYSFQV